MSIAIICPDRNVSGWFTALRSHDPTLKVEIWPEISAPQEVEFALCWEHPAGVLQQFPKLRAISSLGAGVNHLLNDTTRPADIPLLRLVDENLKQSMAEYVMHGVLDHCRRFADYRRQQTECEWQVQKNPTLSDPGIGIMGCGEIGGYVANRLSDLGFRVFGWSRRPRKMDAIQIYSGRSELGSFLNRANILVCLLPLTPQTENILNKQTFSQLPPDAYLINVARGAHLVESDLLAALASGQLSGALLDVFRQEPLDAGHPFWSHDRITVTPHIASVTNPDSAAEQIIENYRRLHSGEPLLNRIDIESGY